MKTSLKVLFYYVFFLIWVIAIASLNAFVISAIAVGNTKYTVISSVLIVLWWILTIIFNIIDKRDINKNN